MDEQTQLSAAFRQEALEQMSREPLDVLVIGGGITGAGIALDAAARGYRVGLVERSDFASGTSSAATKLVHGGIRYLPQLDVALVREALIERGRLLRNAPHLVHPLAFVLPLYASSRRPVGLPVAPPSGIGLSLILDAGLLTYDILAGRQNVAPHRHISRDDVMRREPVLMPDGLKTGFIYYDAQTNDTRLTMAVLRTAAAHGALLANYAEAVRFEHEGDRLSGVRVRETRAGDAEVTVRARHVVNATGVWAEQTERLSDGASRLTIAPSRGTHLVFHRETLDIGDEAVVLPETEDGRIIFLVPWLSSVIVGTTDTEVEEIDSPRATDDDIDYLLEHLNRSIRTPVSRADIVSTYAGNRPLVHLRAQTGAASHLSRSHAIVEAPDGLITISGGKLTTYRQMAEDVMDRIDRRDGRDTWHPTRNLKLVGATRLAEARERVRLRALDLGLTSAEVTHLLNGYGDETPALLDLIAAEPELRLPLAAGLPYLRAEVVHAVRDELALTVEDVLARRTRMSLEDATRGVDAVHTVAELMARELGWTAEQEARQVVEYARYAEEQAGPLRSLLAERLHQQRTSEAAELEV